MKVKTAAIGSRFGRWRVKKNAGLIHGRSHVLCRCECGFEGIRSVAALAAGRTTSCGCFIREKLRVIATKHGCAKNNKKTVEYNTWTRMIARCTHPNANYFHRYGARGIRVCNRWRHSFENFIADMGLRPPNTSLDRINNDGNYEPSNCRWATTLQQCS